MNYQEVYNKIIDHAKNNPPTGYTEDHHIIPKSLGGNDAQDNIVSLTARQHFICHWLLTKMYIGENRAKMIYALRMMKAKSGRHQRYDTRITARVYENLKNEYSIIVSSAVSGEKNGMYGKKHTKETIEKIRQANIGRIQPEHEKQKQIAAITGRKREPFSEEWIANLCIANGGKNNPMYGKKHSQESIEKIREKAQGRKYNRDVIEKRAAAVRGRKTARTICEHCEKDVAVNIYARWHGDKCKFKPSL